MSGYFTNLLFDDSIGSTLGAESNVGVAITGSQHSNDSNLHHRTQRSSASIPQEQHNYVTNSRSETDTATSLHSLSATGHSYIGMSSRQAENEQQLYQEMDDDQQDSQQESSQTRESIMTAIENSLLELIASLSMLKPVELSFMARPLRRRSNNSNSSPSTSTEHSTPSEPSDQDGGHEFSEPQMKILSLSQTMGATTLTRYVRVLEVIYDALGNNVMMTKRDIFYRDLPLFKSQQTVDKIVDDICCHYNVPRSSLNVSASGKGRIYGPASIILKNHRVLNCLAAANVDESDCNDEYGVLIPPMNQILDIECRGRFVIVVEKEASFRHLVSVGFVQMLLQQCILVTGCGYPDFATRHLIKHISLRYSWMPILAVMDNDPYGLDIYSVYKWGSLAQAHDSVSLTIPSMVLLGLECDDRNRYQIPEAAYVPLTFKDREKVIRMISIAQQMHRGYHSTPESKAFIADLCKLLHTNQKCELQALVTNGSLGFIDYMRMKIEHYICSMYSY